ncbi:hypothetical protein FNYG_14831 [Fusarium nygamai]|uniref:Uncharacterized protein n=1 Tax=Gibberella nygamai TaxID=42673 RepID=A0A2K0UPZ9_GIBNY|nr:hypothetical protein FNYG_14831 [Fusarium nygamai]
MQGTNRFQVSRSRGKKSRHNNPGLYHVADIPDIVAADIRGEPANTTKPINLQAATTHLRALPGIDCLGCIHRLDSSFNSTAPQQPTTPRR